MKAVQQGLLSVIVVGSCAMAIAQAPAGAPAADAAGRRARYSLSLRRLGQTAGKFP